MVCRNDLGKELEFGIDGWLTNEMINYQNCLVSEDSIRHAHSVRF